MGIEPTGSVTVSDLNLPTLGWYEGWHVRYEKEHQIRICSFSNNCLIYTSFLNLLTCF
jgi:hypothetical protein